MRNSALVATATLALLLAPSLATAQGPHWIFEVPIDLETINQNVTRAKVLCATLDHAPDPAAPAERFGGGSGTVGLAESADIPLNAQGSLTGVTSVPVTAGPKGPGAATHYVCWLYLDYREPGPDQAEIELQPRSGTELVSRVMGTLP